MTGIVWFCDRIPVVAGQVRWILLMLRYRSDTFNLTFCDYGRENIAGTIQSPVNISIKIGQIQMKRSKAGCSQRKGWTE
jgi:hypothetical protein